MNLMKILTMYFSVICYGILYYITSNSLKYKSLDEVEIVIKYLNEYFANYYFQTLNHDMYNSILVNPETDYCIRSDVYKFYHPDSILQDTYIIREAKGLIKEYLQKTYFDSLPNIVFKRKNAHIPPQHKLPVQLTLPFTYYDQLIHSFATGISSLCLFQKYNHLPERHALSYKNSLTNNQINYIEHMKAKNMSDDCIRNATFLPNSYRFYVEKECKEFFQFSLSKEYKENLGMGNQYMGPKFITKQGLEVHRGRGITVLFLDEMKELQEKYEYGNKCGQINDLLVAQEYINNPYLYKGHKIEFRIYWIIASTNPLIVYAFDKALIRRCIFPYDVHSTAKGAHVCNTAIVKQEKSHIEENANDSKEEIFIDWKLDYLQELLLEQGKISDSNWLSQTLLPTAHRYIIHAIRSAEDKFSRDSKLAEFLCADFLLTDDLEIYMLEINYNPQTLKTTSKRVFWHNKMIQDMIEINNAYLRSKYLRFRGIIMDIVTQMKKYKQSFRQTFNNEKIQQINSAYIDKLDQNIEISSSNLFTKIVDENQYGTKIYGDLLQQKCI